MKISEDILRSLLRIELPNTEHLKNIKGIENILVRQAKKESSLQVYAERYEKHLDDSSCGLFQLLKGTMKWLGFSPNSVFDYFLPEINIKYALKYLDKLYSEFPEVHNKNERLAMALASYNMGKGNVNKAMKEARKLEEIYYERINTIQGKWATYKTMILLAEKHGIISEANANINKRYISYILRG